MLIRRHLRCTIVKLRTLRRTLDLCSHTDRVLTGDQRLEARRSRKNATPTIVKWTGGEEFLATTPSGHDVPFDADRKHNAAPGPMEMLLAALGACSMVDVVLILAKKRQKLTSLEVDVSGERADRFPRSGRKSKWSIASPASWMTRPCATRSS